MRSVDDPAPRALDELDVGTRRRKIARSVLVSTVTVAAIVVAYFVIPFDRRAGNSVALRVLLALVILVAVTVIAVVNVLRAEFPMLKAAESLVGVVSFSIVAFASVYALMSSADSAAFSEPLDQVGALYFSLTAATTVGFGDIHPKSDPARIVVMIQMVVNVVVLGVAAKVLLNAARRRVQR